MDGVTYSYYYAGGKLLRLTYGDNVLDFFYDASGKPYVMRQGYASSSNYTDYYYITNLQGDVIRLVDIHGNGTAYYEYDPYGNAIYAGGSHANINPLRYRGYVYDTDTGLYYLQSRYYDPQTGRFINADSYASTGQGIIGHNMFAYCGNNPVCCFDPAGTSFLYDWWNAAEDAIWKLGAKALKSMGYDLTGELLELSASGPGNSYTADKNSPIAKKIASDKGFVNSVMEDYNSGVNGQSDGLWYEFPVSQGDLGAALHNVSYTFKPTTDGKTGKRYLSVTITDTFDFTEMKNPFAQDSLKSGFLWLANDIACIDMKWGLLDPVSVKIEVEIPIKP